jgi:hypothetical protein
MKREALMRGEPLSPVEAAIRQCHELLRQMDYAGKTRGKLVAIVYSFLGSRGYTVPKKLLRLDMADELLMRVPEREDVEVFVQYAGSLERKLLYTLMTEIPCRPRVFPTLRWNWLEEKWQEKDFVHVSLPKQFRPANQGGPKKFEPICFLGPKSVGLMKQVREAKIRNGNVPLETDRIFQITFNAMYLAVRHDFEAHVQKGLIKPSRHDENGVPIEQSISPKSWRKYQFNIIDAIPDISPEWH